MRLATVPSTSCTRAAWLPRNRDGGDDMPELLHTPIYIPAGDAEVIGDLELPDGAEGLVVFAHGSGSSRLSGRNQRVASVLRQSGRFGTLLFDLLTGAEDQHYENRFDIDLLATRLQAATERMASMSETADLRVGYFGASTGAAAAIVAAVRSPGTVRTVVSRGGRPDLAGKALERLDIPTLLIVGGDDDQVIYLNRQALAKMPADDKRVVIVPGATHLFEEPGTLDRAAAIAADWFETHL